MLQENEMDPGKPHSEISALEIYLQECDFSRLRTLGIILSHRPELYEICRNLITLQPESWSELLQGRPDLAEECDCWEKFPAVRARADPEKKAAACAICFELENHE